MKAEKGVYPKDRQILADILPIDTPLSIDIHMNHFCNFKCNYCVLTQSDEALHQAGFRRERMSWETFSLLVEQMKQFPHKFKMATMSGMGESIMHPRIVDMVRALSEANVTHKIQIISNASKLMPELSRQLIDAGLGELKISLQGLSSKKYKEIAGVDVEWDDIYKNICFFSSIRGKCALKVKIADTALDPGDEEKFYEMFGDICDAVDVEHIYDAWAVKGIDIDYHSLDIQETRYHRPLIDNKVCRYPFTSIDIQPDGQYTTYCHMVFGFEKKIQEKSIYDQWNSVEQNKFRLAMLNGKDQFEACRRCTFINNTYHPEDLLMGYEDEIRKRLIEMYSTQALEEE